MFDFVTVNIFVIAIYFLTRTIYSISRFVEIVNYRTVVHRTVMTLWTWVKSMIQVDMSFGHGRKRRQHKNNKHHGPRYYVRHIKRNSSRVCWRRSYNRFCIFHVFASIPKTTIKTDKQLHKDAHQIHFDSDSFIIGIDNHASRSISNNIDHFTTALRSPKNAFIQGVGGELLKVKGEGTLVWHIEDDEGRAHRITIKDSLFVPKAPICLLSPQHWAQSVDDIHPKPHGTWCADYHDCLVLHWNQEQFHRTIPWDRRTNVARLRSAAGTVKYRTFSATFDMGNEMEMLEHVVLAAPHLIPDDEDDQDRPHDIALNNQQQTVFEPITTIKHSEQPISQSDTIQQTREENLSDFLTEVPLQPTPNVIEDDEGRLAGESNQADLLRWHYRLGHLSFAKIKLLALLTILPRKLAAVKPPKCAGCLYGSMTKRPWRTKSAQNKGRLRTVQVPGECISVDQLESPLPGFVAQLKGKLTRKCYKAATVFVDHKSRLSYVHLQEGLTSKETVEAKHAFEAYARVFGINIRHYHADNGRFADNAFMKDVATSGQTISFCGVNAHFQNGIAEKMIRDLQESTRKQLLHAKSRWPKAIELNLWPYALRLANHLRNSLPDRDDATSPIERFSRVQVAPHLRENHPFGCPVYALNNRLQSGNRIPKWNSRARLGVYLGPSPRHASSVSLVLSLETGLVSPQFHV
jgi:hypothetical protein